MKLVSVFISTNSDFNIFYFNYYSLFFYFIFNKFEMFTSSILYFDKGMGSRPQHHVTTFIGLAKIDML